MINTIDAVTTLCCLPSAPGMDASSPGFLRNQISPFLVAFGIVNSNRWNTVQWSIYRLRARNCRFRTVLILKMDFAVTFG